MNSLAVEYYQISEDIIKKVRKSFGKDEESVKQDLQLLHNWWNKQPHLPQNQDDVRLERILLRNKFRIERTKIKIDNYYTMRAIHSNHFTDIKQNYNDIIAASNEICIAQAPTLTDQHERLVYCSIRSPDAPLNWKRIFSYAFLCLESKLSYDYTIGERYVINCTNVSMQHYTSITKEIPALLTAIQLYQEAYSGRIIALHCVNAPLFMDVFLTLFKMMLKPKLMSKIVIHNSLEDLHKSVDPAYLPSCFGGSLQSAKHYNEKLKTVILDQKDEILKNLSQVSNEALRSEMSPANQMFGVAGSFKKINID